MDEWIPILVGCCVGSLVFLVCRGLVRVLAGAAGIALAGLVAVMVSGEYHISWGYLLVDLAEAAAGCGAGVVAVQSLRRAQIAFASGNAGQERMPGH